MLFRKPKKVDDAAANRTEADSNREKEFFEQLMGPSPSAHPGDNRHAEGGIGLKRLRKVSESDDEDFGLRGSEATPKTYEKRPSGVSQGSARESVPRGKSPTPAAANNAKSGKPKPERGSTAKQAEKTGGRTGEIFMEEEEGEQFLDATPSWALRENLLDKKMRPWGHPDYDPTTLYIPKGELDKLTPAMHQYWLAKADNFDKILFFKLGKFYELFYEDATVGVRELDLNYMGRKQHAGFPESALDRYLSRMVALGYKVAVVEQTETDRQLNARLKHGKPAKNDRIIRREMVSAHSRGTIVDLKAENHLATLWSLVQTGPALSALILNYETSRVSFTQVDLSTEAGLADFKLLLINFRPDEILARLGQVDEKVREILANLPHKPQLSVPRPADGLAKRAALMARISERNPELVAAVEAETRSDRVGTGLFTENVHQLMGYMDSMLLLERLVLNCELTRLVNVCAVDELFMDSQALAHLELLEGQGGSEAGSLVQVIDRCRTPFGKRKLRKMLQRPSADSDEIGRRLDAVVALGVAATERKRFCKMLTGLKDLEKQTIQLSRYSLAADKRFVLFEDATSKKLRELGDFLTQVEAAVDGLGALGESRKLLRASPMVAELLAVLDGDTVRSLIEELRGQMVDGEAGVTPPPGTSREFDECESGVKEVFKKAEGYAATMRARLACPDIGIVQSKFRFELEVPEHFAKGKGLPKDFSFVSKRAGFDRFMTPFLEQLIDDLEGLEERRKEVLTAFGSGIFKGFLEQRDTWVRLAAVLAHLDVLCGLAEFSFESPHTLCRPSVFPIGHPDGPFIKAEGLKHPVLAALDSNFVGNAVEMTPLTPIIVLSGPNMGGKSTIMRTVALNVVLAQLGCFVFAEAFQASAVDKLFTRVGASDRLEEKKSTFFIEMEETRAILTAATPYSLAIVDELGRGTSTFDGYSIACACLAYLAGNLRCRTLFATHYYFLESDLGTTAGLRFQRMGYEIRRVGDQERLRFLFLLEDGPSEKSFALNVALLAGIETQIVQRAEEICGWHRETHDW